MIELIVLIAGIVYAFRRPKLKALTTEQLPAMPQEAFVEWKALELKSIDFFLWATWGVLLISVPIRLMMAVTFPDAEDAAMGVKILSGIVAVFLLLSKMAPAARKASVLKARFGVKWP
jgi:hypothetical protein